MVRLLYAILTTLVLSSLVIPATLAQDQDLPADSKTETDSSTDSESRPIEEIQVFSERTFFTLRLEIESAETEVYGLFNELNSSDDFDVKCTREVYVGSYFKRRSCMAAYLREEQARNAQSSVQGVDILLSLDAIQVETRQKAIAMEAEMLKLAQEHPEFAAALLKLTALVGALQVKKEESPFFFK